MARKNMCPAHRDWPRVIETKKGPVVKGGSESERKERQESIDRSQKEWEEAKKNGKLQELRDKRRKEREELPAFLMGMRENFQKMQEEKYGS